MNIGFIGAGKVGFSLGKYFSEQGMEVSGYYSRTAESARQAAEFTGTRAFDSLEALVSKSQWIFLTVPDSLIEDVWEQLRLYPLTGKIICHCSGALSTEVLKGAAELGAFACSMHPLYAIHDRYNSYSSMGKIMFTLEGSNAATDTLEQMLRRLGNPVCRIATKDKTKYHAAAVMLSNQVVALAETGTALLKECGLSEAAGLMVLETLMAGNVDNIIRVGTREALTGPVERNDCTTVKKHLEVLSGKNRRIYAELSEVLVEIAKRKHPDQDYSRLLKELYEL